MEYTMKYYLTMRKKETLPFKATWMDFGDIMLILFRQEKTKIV